jgi:hypothetical protein
MPYLCSNSVFYPQNSILVNINELQVPFSMNDSSPSLTWRTMDSADDQILSQINRLMSDERDASNSEDDFSNQQWAIQVHA